MSDKLRSELDRAVDYEQNHGEGRVIREVLYALDREYGADAVLDQLNHLAGHDSDFRASLEERKAEHRNGRLG